MSDEIAKGTESEDTEILIDEQESNGSEEVSESEETSSEASSESDDGTSDEEWVVPGRFKTVEDLRKSYTNLESEFSRRSNELHALKTREGQPKIDPTERVKRFADDVKRDPVEAIERIVEGKTREVREEVEQHRFNTEYQRLMSNKEFAELEPTMVNLTNQLNPFLTSEQKRDPQLLHWLFYTARGVKADEKARSAEKKGIQKGERSASKKSKVAVEGASGSKGHIKRSFEKLTREEMKAEIERGRLHD